MEPSNKKRRLAPKLAEKPLHEQSQQVPYNNYKPLPPVQDAAPPPERTDFESFARHLQDAAMLIYAQANRSPYTAVSVLLVRWEDDMTFEQDLLLLQQVFRERFHYRTETYTIPTCPNPSMKLTVQMAQHLEFSRPDHLWVVYYAGYGFVGSDHNLYWACHNREDSCKLKWDGVRCLIEDAQSDILLLLDTCAVADSPSAGSHGVKQAIAAYSPDQSAREPGGRSFTQNLIEALGKLGTGRPFSIQRLHEEIISMKHNVFLQPPMANGSGKAGAGHERMPVCFSLTPGALQSISLAPIGQQPPGGSHMVSPLGSPENDISRNHEQAQMMRVSSNSDLTFEEMRALVCTTFLGEPSQEMASFKQWLHNTPVAASKIAVEGMFHGPPTVLLVSMPIAVWNVVAADRTCAFLGYINSHNMTTEYQRLISGIAPIGKAATFKELEDGKILLEARQAAASTPVMIRHEPSRGESIQQDSMRQEMVMGTPNSVPQVVYPEAGPSNIPEHKDDHLEDSVEMHEAAEQLKALSHVRHLSHDHANSERNNSHIASEDSPGLRSAREESVSSQEAADSGVEDPMYSSEYNSPASRPKPRRSIQKQGPKQDTRCSLCSHAPFKDSSSLRKHIAAAHTRPFPCAFSFAGCTSTFGSKNEWKRHIASQHLCLTYYRCSSCPQSTVEGKGNEFNRKDLFTQHLRRMHAPFAIKKAIAKGDSKLQLEWEGHVKEMQNTCLVVRRQPPQRSACPKPDCANVFEGAGSWDDWTEHVGRHMEKGEAGRLGVDRMLARWALDEKIIERREDGEYRLVGTERDGAVGAGYYSDGNGGVKPKHEIEEAKGEGDSMLLDG
ncbi:uncharacterized protein LY89DRAFT_706617 [Mollisia scopiformis]|uniref:C2H2-type domain-containing protein n=1 Tax=Mollisia scopiformis TaxID=149040 RepID=A0A194XCX2_MOLSC|nr:uncharacterized protein LY89DRAFT_706617 [Mollisia scopiformis]KUJ18001.1 hypothetical protein LY89DRAFT_706617 [Mollisia scopiformis]